jgi:hypothetical protein
MLPKKLTVETMKIPRTFLLALTGTVVESGEKRWPIFFFIIQQVF